MGFIPLKLKIINMPDNWLLWSPTNSKLNILHPSLSQKFIEEVSTAGHVSFHMDEIHLRSEYSYKGGKIIGSFSSPNKHANTILGFMVSSLFTRWSTIVRLLLCSETDASEIFPITKKVIWDFESCILFVVTIITNNYPLNVHIFKIFSPTSKLEHSILLTLIAPYSSYLIMFTY